MKPTPFHVFANLLSLNHSCQTLVQGVAIDSRKVEAGDLFFALPGNRVDGHSFLEEIASKGAVGAVVREDYVGQEHGLALLRVPDVRVALQQLARVSLARRRSKVIAITGSLGKTTSKEFTAALLRSRYKVYASPHSYNSKLTVPLNILTADGDEDYLILEMGMTHAGDLQGLISIAPPHIALLTTVAVQHAINFSDGITGISREKASIFSHPQTVLGILHRDIAHFDEAMAVGTCPKQTFSLSTPEADFYLEPSEKGVLIHTKGESPVFCPLNLPIKVHHHNFLAAVAVARALHVPWEAIVEVSATLKLPPMRFEPVEKQGILFINDAYNANPDAINAALENLPKPKPGKKTIAVLSEMDALGTYSEEGHTQVAQTALSHADHLLCVGTRCAPMCALWEAAGKPVQLHLTRADLGVALKALAEPGDVVLLKGARSYALDQLLAFF